MADDKISMNTKDMPETPQAKLRALQSGNLENQTSEDEISPVPQLQRAPAPGRMPLFRS